MSSIATPLLTQPGADLSKTQNAAANPAAGNPKDSRAHKAAQQFEAMMIGEMMKTVREGGEDGGWLGSGDETGDDTAISMAESQFSQAMAANGGLGLAHMIEQSIGREQTEKNPSSPSQTLSVAPH